MVTCISGEAQTQLDEDSQLRQKPLSGTLVQESAKTVGITLNASILDSPKESILFG